MNGHAQDNDNDQAGQAWYRLRDEMTGEDKGYIAPDGETRDADADTVAKVREAFSRDLIAMDNEVVDELGGVCFDGVCTIAPANPEHAGMVLRNLGALTGLRPEPLGTKETESPAAPE